MVDADELLIDRTGPPGRPGLVRAAARRDGRLVALRLERDPPPAVVPGTLFLGRVRQAAGPQGVFVDLGTGPWGLLRTGKLPLLDGTATAVRVAAAGIGAKGPRLTAALALPGRLLVLLPGPATDASDQVPGSAHGRFQRRPAADSQSWDALVAEAARLDALWAGIAARQAAAKAPALLWRPPGPVACALRDLAPTAGRIALDGPAVFAAGRRYAEAEAPDLLDRLERHAGGAALFDASGAGDELEALVGTRIELAEGAWLAVEETQAVVAIDVNAGPRKAPRGVNRDAAAECARQLALRGLGGLIVIDFLKTGDGAERKAIAADLDAALRAWGLEVQAHGFTRGGLYELSCTRSGPSLRERLAEAARDLEDA